MIVEHNTSRRFGWIALLALGVLLLAALFVIKTNALAAQKHERRLVKTLEREVQEIRMLKAEIAHLESPERISALAQTHLGIAAGDPDRIIALDQVDEIVADRPETQPEALQ